MTKIKWELKKNTAQVYTSGIGVVEKNGYDDLDRWFATTAITHKRVGPFATDKQAKKFLEDINSLEVEFNKKLEDRAHAVDEFCGVWN